MAARKKNNTPKPATDKPATKKAGTKGTKTKPPPKAPTPPPDRHVKEDELPETPAKRGYLEAAKSDVVDTPRDTPPLDNDKEEQPKPKRTILSLIRTRNYLPLKIIAAALVLWVVVSLIRDGIAYRTIRKATDTRTDSLAANVPTQAWVDSVLKAKAISDSAAIKAIEFAEEATEERERAEAELERLKVDGNQFLNQRKKQSDETKNSILYGSVDSLSALKDRLLLARRLQATNRK